MPHFDHQRANSGQPNAGMLAHVQVHMCKQTSEHDGCGCNTDTELTGVTTSQKHSALPDFVQLN
jgi:hypothetical protein